ncbi:MAG: T9SS type A sorting domain-containing protein [Bacteroidales bacterium]
MKRKILFEDFIQNQRAAGKCLCKALLLAMVLAGANVFGSFAQEAVTVSGGNASGSGGTVSYSVGQVFYSTFSGADGSVAEGVQQPFEISVVTSIEGTSGITVEMAVYPNPVTDHLILRVIDYDREDLSYQLFDIRGGLVANAKVTSIETTIMMGACTPGVYLLRVNDNIREVKTFRIIKN